MCGCTCGREELATALSADLSVPDFHNEYTLSTVLGSGRFGTVRVGMDKEGKPVAVKCLPLRLFKKRADTLYREIQILRKTAYVHIIKYYGCYLTRHSVYIVMELCSGGSLKDRMDKGPLTEDQGRAIAKHLLEALAYLHSIGIVHRDIKPENILFDDSNIVKLADFGLSRSLLSSEKLSIVGTPYFIAPEMIEGSYTEKCDIWSLGVLLYTAMLGKRPFRGQTLSELGQKIKTKDIKKWGEMSLEAMDFLQKVLVKDPKQRPSATELLNHNWIKKDGASTDVSFERESIQW